MCLSKLIFWSMWTPTSFIVFYVAQCQINCLHLVKGSYGHLICTIRFTIRLSSSSMDEVEPFAFELDLHAYHMLHCDVTITKIVTISSHVIQILATVPGESFHGRISTTSLVVALFADFLHCLSHCRLSCFSLFWQPFTLISPSIMVLDIHIGLGDTSPEPRQVRRHYGEYILLHHCCFCVGWLLTHKYIN